jgi:hypothetical protein
MSYLHDSLIMSHGYLNSHNCCIDAKFTLKIADYGLSFFHDRGELKAPHPADNSERSYELLLWRAPELLRQTMPPEGTPVRISFSKIHQIALKSFFSLL